MKTLVSMFALALALAFTGPAFAGDVTAAKNQADCEKAGGAWDAATNKCSEKKMINKPAIGLCKGRRLFHKSAPFFNVRRFLLLEALKAGREDCYASRERCDGQVP